MLFMRKKNIFSSKFTPNNTNNGVKKIGEPVKKTLIRFSKLLEFKLIPKKIAPKNKLPESPINIFEGFQLKNKNKINPPTNAHKTEGNERKIIEELNKTIILPANRPSIPSIKLKKFIVEIPINPSKNCKKKVEPENF